MVVTVMVTNPKTEAIAMTNIMTMIDTVMLAIITTTLVPAVVATLVSRSVPYS